MKRLGCTQLGLLLACASAAVASVDEFSFAPYLDLEPTLSVSLVTVHGLSVRVEGSDTARPEKPFVFDWGDGTTTEGRFPATHSYKSADRSYTITVTATHDDGTESVTVRAALGPPDYGFQRLQSLPRRVSIPKSVVPLRTTMPGYAITEKPEAFAEDELQPNVRTAIEYVMDVAHQIELDFCNGDVTEQARGPHVILKQRQFAGCASQWYSDPPSFECHPGYLVGEVDFSSLFHELGHSMTLNSPAKYRIGGKIDSPMSGAVSEALANFFQHATIYRILNTEGHWGLSDGFCALVREAGIRSIGVVRNAHKAYLSEPDGYTMYNDPATPRDETFNTFMTVVYVFCSLAEEHRDYRTPLKRTMRLLQTFNEADEARFLDRENEGFRATLMVAAMSYGFDTDLRERFRKLHFPVSDAVYEELRGRIK
jgi:hypothetical protein